MSIPRRAGLYAMLSLIAIAAALAALACGRSNQELGAPQPPPSSSTATPPTSVTALPQPINMPSPDSYVALAPIILRSGHTENVSLTLFKGSTPAAATVSLALYQGDRRVAESSAMVRGTGNVPLDVPKLDRGEYTLEVRGPGFSDRANLKVEDGTLVFLETDKPIYKPGHTIHIRIITLDIDLKPWPAPVTIEVQDAKGTKVFKQDVATDEYGMATLDMPLSTEPNLGVWKVSALMGERTTQVDVRVEEYVLPKYEIVVDTQKGWALANERISGTISAEYTFGKPVVGELQIVASRFVGQWEEYARVTRQIDGETDFELPPVQYVAGVPGAQGMGNVTLDITVTERGTGYQEKTTHLLTIASTPVNIQVIPEGTTFKPSLPFSFLIVTETPDGQPVDANVSGSLYFMGKNIDLVKEERIQVSTQGGKAIVSVTPPAEAVAVNLEVSTEQASTSLTLQSGYSPSGNFIHLEQVADGPISVGDTVQFHVNATREAVNFYYEVISRGKVIFSDVSRTPDIAIDVTHLMAPSSRLLVYQILPNNEVAADYLPFDVQADYAHEVEARFSEGEARPGDSIDINVQTQGEARVGLVAVDRSVFILAENRLNLQQVFDELERLYQQPQVELHEARFMGDVTTRGAMETFTDAGVVVMTNKTVPEGEKYENKSMWFRGAMMEDGAVLMAVPQAAATTPAAAPAASPAPSGLAEVQRVRQFFPETWLWTDLTTDLQGIGRLAVTVPDSITTWVLRAVGLSKEHGLGVAESELRVFQPFFLQVDLPYSAIRGEEFPVKIALYNYLETPQEIFVEIERADWFDLLDTPSKSATVAANEIGGIEFKIRPTKLGTNGIKITARSTEAADAVIKELIIEPEGVQREIVENHVLSDGDNREVSIFVPGSTIDGSARAYITITGSYLTQTIEGLDGLLQMPFGCGEQNMILFAPNVFIARYLRETGQLKPEVMAKTEHLMMTGYQREFIYRRADGSFSAFGDSDDQGSLWLTAFVVKTFSQAKGLMYIDQAVLDDAAAWMKQHQKSDGSFEPVGFLHHQELLGGLQGENALTAYVALALIEAGESDAANRAVRYLEGQLNSIDDAYTMAITAYALGLADSGEADDAYDKLMDMAKEDENGGLYWGDEPVFPEPLPGDGGPRMPMPFDMQMNRSAAVETTGYALMALIERDDRFNASRASRWLATQRNAFGGFGSTQDTVVGLQGLTAYATNSRADTDMTVVLEAGSWRHEARITPQNADVLQMIEVPVGETIKITASGRGDAVLQSVLRYNVPQAMDKAQSIFDIDVTYDTDQVEVNDTITLLVDVTFNPGEPIEAGMVVLDIAVPTGFAPVRESIEAVMSANPAKMKRFDIAGRKVIFYIEDMLPGESVSFRFDAMALYPVRAKGVTSEAYSYYKPELRGETLGTDVTVAEAR